MKKSIFLLFAAISAIAAAQIVPQPLAPGARIAIITPASCIDSMVVVDGMATLRSWGFEPVVMDHVYGHAYGDYSACDSARAADVMRAFTDPEIDAIMCSRGGYGSGLLLPYFDMETVRENPKWLIGYSDITALHAFMNKAGIASIHGPMLGHLSEHSDDDSANYLFQLLANGLPLEYAIPADAFNNPGEAEGKLVGGNFIVANNFAQTPWDIFDQDDDEDFIIFVEDVGEKIYAIERMLTRLHQSGILEEASGIVFGDFTKYKPDGNFDTMEEMLAFRLAEWGYYDKPNFPIVFHFPAGHGDVNYPLVLNVPVRVTVTGEGAALDFRP